MSDALEDVENRVQTFSLAEQIHLLIFIANNINKRSSILNNLNTKVVVPLTSNTINADLRGNVFLPKNESGLSKDSVALIHQIVIVDKISKLHSRHAVKPAAEQSIVPSLYFDEPKKCYRIFLNGSSIVGRYNQLLCYGSVSR